VCEHARTRPHLLSKRQGCSVGAVGAIALMVVLSWGCDWPMAPCALPDQLGHGKRRRCNTIRFIKVRREDTRAPVVRVC
jgi:hypothetical protein